MNSNPKDLDSSQVLASLRSEGDCGLAPELESRLLRRVELSVAGLALPVPSGVSGASLSKASLTDNYSASLALHPVATLVGTLALGGLLGVMAHSGYVNAKGTPGGPSVNSVQVASATPSAAVPTLLPPVPIVSIDQLPAIPNPLLKGSERSAFQGHPSAKVVKESELSLAPATLDNKVSLAEQLAQLELARTALSHKDAATALQKLEAHAHQYPNSPLTEEREALAIKGLFLANRVGEARAKLVQFEQQFPNSLMLPALRESNGTFH